MRIIKPAMSACPPAFIMALSIRLGRSSGFSLIFFFPSFFVFFFWCAAFTVQHSGHEMIWSWQKASQQKVAKKSCIKYAQKGQSGCTCGGHMPHMAVSQSMEKKYKIKQGEARRGEARQELRLLLFRIVAALGPLGRQRLSSSWYGITSWPVAADKRLSLVARQPRHYSSCLTHVQPFAAICTRKTKEFFFFFVFVAPAEVIMKQLGVSARWWGGEHTCGSQAWIYPTCICMGYAKVSLVSQSSQDFLLNILN